MIGLDMIVNYESSASTFATVIRSQAPDAGITNTFADFFTKKLQEISPSGLRNMSAKEELANIYGEQLDLLSKQRVSTLEAIAQEPGEKYTEDEKQSIQVATNKNFHHAAVDLRISYGKAQLQVGVSKGSDGRMKIETPSDLGKAVSQYADEQRVALWHRVELRGNTVEADILSATFSQLENIALRKQRDAEDAADALATDESVREYRNTLYAQMTTLV